MKRILIPLCIVVGSHVAYGQRSYQFDAPDRLFVEGKELFSLKNYAGCIDKLEAYKQHSTNADLIQEADYMLVYAAYEQGRPNADELLKDYLEEYTGLKLTVSKENFIGGVRAIISGRNILIDYSFKGSLDTARRKFLFEGGTGDGK